MTIAENLGRLFEVGFNLGILAYIEQQQIPHHFGDLYRHDLEQLKLPKMVQKMIDSDRLISDLNTKIVEKWSQYLLQKGFLGGLNFFREYLQATGWSPQGRRKTQDLEILYYQCSFCNNNSLGTYPKNQYKDQEFTDLLSQFGELENIDALISQYSGKGEFLQGDTLLLLRYKNQYRILCVDLSTFSVKSAADLAPLDDVEVLRRMLMTEIKYVRSKSVFSKLRIDTGNSEYLRGDFSKDLAQYFTAFKRKDKETAKLIQAGSYIHSFYGFLQRQRQKHQILPDDADVVFNVVGYSDRHLSTLSLRPENLDILATFAQIYKHEPKHQEIQNARRKVLQLIQRNAAKSFIDGKQLIQELSTKPLEASINSITKITHTEKIDNFFNSLGIIPDDLATQLNVTPGKTLRNAHAELIQQALLSDNTYIFLTGNPGIGKTTAIANFLKSRKDQDGDDGYLFLYVSPRKQVNLDLIEKFKSNYSPDSPEKPGKLSDTRIFAINSNSATIEDNLGRPTVQYYSDARQDNFRLKQVDFINAAAISSEDSRLSDRRSQKRLHQIAEDQIRDRGEKKAGVLFSICEGIHSLIHERISNQIVATVSIQSLRINPPREPGQQNFTPAVDTLRHLDNIFKGAYNSRDKKVIPEKMREIAQRIKHIFITIDEITGDDSGANFLKGISQFLTKFKLTEHGFNVKIIVADASIVEKEVITQHLAQTTPEPDKIYFRMAKQPAAPLSVQNFVFNKREANAINANSYPASCLNITYQLFIQCVKFDPNPLKEKTNQLSQAVQSQINADIQRLLDNAKCGQILVYIQDKKRLEELIDKIRQYRGEFTPNTDYLEIHANLSEADKQKISQYKQDAKVVFMTSSASRGLSFPKATHILVEIPRFQIERNLMEVIQVIYRARGEYLENGVRQTIDTQEKQLVFYLAETAVYYPDANDVSDLIIPTQESILNLLNILIILKLSIMTRIVGAGILGRKQVMMIPIGGKSVAAAGATFTSIMTNLIREMKNEHRRKPSHKTLEEVYHSLQQILSRAEFILHHDSLSNSVRNQVVSYLQLRQKFNNNFAKLCQRLDNLLELGNIEPGILTGNLLVVQIHQKLEETYQIRLEEQIRRYATKDLVEKMWAISKSNQYPDNLRSQLRNGVELINLLCGDIEKTQWFELTSQNSDQYYALPLFVFISGETLREYFKGQPEEEAEREFRSLLSRYVHSLYPAYNTLPIGRQYREFPFLIFRSYSLAEMRVNMFSDRYLLNSHELNVLNLILAQE